MGGGGFEPGMFGSEFFESGSDRDQADGDKKSATNTGTEGGRDDTPRSGTWSGVGDDPYILVCPFSLSSLSRYCMYFRCPVTSLTPASSIQNYIYQPHAYYYTISIHYFPEPFYQSVSLV